VTGVVVAATAAAAAAAAKQKAKKQRIESQVSTLLTNALRNMQKHFVSRYMCCDYRMISFRLQGSTEDTVVKLISILLWHPAVPKSRISDANAAE
jgi:hypothetical protein